MAPLTDFDGEIVVLFGGIDAMNRQTLAVGIVLFECYKASVLKCVCRTYVRTWEQRWM